MSKKIFFSHIVSTTLFFIIIFISGCTKGQIGTGVEGELSYAIEKIDEVFESHFTVPLPKDYPVVYVELREPLEIPGLKHFVGYYTVGISYGMEKGDLEEFYNDEDLVERFEKDRGVIVLYGAYEGTRVAVIEYSPLHKNMSFLEKMVMVAG